MEVSKINIREILGKRVWAVFGVSKDLHSYGYRVFSTLLENGCIVYPINPRYENIGNHQVYSSINDINDRIDVAVFVVNPKIGIDLLDDVIKAGIGVLWCQPGSCSDEIIEKCRKNGIELVQSCIMAESSYL